MLKNSITLSFPIAQPHYQLQCLVDSSQSESALDKNDDNTTMIGCDCKQSIDLKTWIWKWRTPAVCLPRMHEALLSILRGKRKVKVGIGKQVLFCYGNWLRAWDYCSHRKTLVRIFIYQVERKQYCVWGCTCVCTCVWEVSSSAALYYLYWPRLSHLNPKLV